MSIPIYGDANDTELATTKSRPSLRAVLFEKVAQPLFRQSPAGPRQGAGSFCLFSPAGNFSSLTPCPQDSLKIRTGRGYTPKES